MQAVAAALAIMVAVQGVAVPQAVVGAVDRRS
jgi:hypothetical protein